MITEQEYTTLRQKYDTYHAARKIVCKAHPNCVTPEDAKLLPEAPTHAEISSIEVYEFCTNPPDKYFLYVNDKKDIVTTWTGEKLGDCYLGRKYGSNFGDTRRSIYIYAINGKRYYGTFFYSAGDYAIVKVCKD